MKSNSFLLKVLNYKNLITLPTLVLSFSMMSALCMEWQHQRHVYQTMQQKLRHMLDHHSEGLTPPAQQRDGQQVQSILNVMSSDTGVIGAAVTDSRADLLGQIGQLAPHETGPRHTVHDVAPVKSQEGKDVGTLALTWSDPRPHAGVLLRLGSHVLLMSCALLTVVGFTSHRYRRRTSMALRHLFAVLPPASQAQQAKAEYWNPEDVLDTAIVAFRDMQQRLDDLQSRLRDAYGAMEQRIQERTRMLAQARAEAVAVNRVTTDMLLTKCHTMQTLSDGMIRLTDNLLETQLTPAQQSRLRAVQDAAQALIAIRYALEGMMRDEAHPATLTCDPFDLHRLLESSLDFFAEQAQEKGLILLSCIHPNVPRQVSGDPGRLRHLLLNLLANAVEFTDTGTVALSAEQMDADDTVVTLRFEVHDTGKGIEPDVLGSLLDKPSLSDTDRAQGSDRAGLGLPVCKQLAAAMHGTIGAQRAPHAGSSFWATVQLGCLERGEKVAPTLDHLVDRRILLVDAIELNRTLCQRQFAARGLQMTTASDPEAALWQIVAADERGQPFDFIIILHQPPTCDGLSLCHQLRHTHTPGQATCILVTSLPLTRSISYLAEKLFDTHMHTPLHESRLIESLATVVGPHPVPRLDVESAIVPANLPRRLRILLVEDNHVNQRVAVSILRKWRHWVDIAENGLEALEAMRQHTYDLVLMDIQMPEMDGIEATKRIRQLEGESAQVPIVAMTANTIYSDPERVVETGMNDYLPKPISQDRLQAMLQRYASGKPTLNPEPEPPRPQIDTSIPLLGDDVLGYLLDEFSSDTVAELIEDYTSHSKDLLSQVLTANEAGDMDMVEYGIHTLKGMSGALGALRLTETCQEILEACRKQQAKHVESQLKDLPDMAQETQRALEAWRVRG